MLLGFRMTRPDASGRVRLGLELCSSAEKVRNFPWPRAIRTPQLGVNLPERKTRKSDAAKAAGGRQSHAVVA